MHETTVLITGAFGFMGRNLGCILRRQPGVRLIEYGRSTPREVLVDGLREADIVIHLAGVNRPESVDEFERVNASFTAQLCEALRAFGRAPAIVFASSIQADMDNPYGASKRKAEEILQRFGEMTRARIAIFRLKNVFGKWCRPNYNSVTATFCHNIARDLPITISDPDKSLELVYIDDVCAAMAACAGVGSTSANRPVIDSDSIYQKVSPVFKTTLGELAARIRSFRDFRRTLHAPDFGDAFLSRLYATYLSYLDEDDFVYGLDLKSDARGCLAEFLKAPSFGQIFVSRTKPGVTRGDHYHHTKTEKFFVLEGQAVVRFRHIRSDAIIEYRVEGKEFRVLDIPPGYTHSIENVGETDLLTLFWADEVFDPHHPDTYFEKVIQ